MKREEILKRIGVSVPQQARIRVLIDTDAKNEADDQYAIMHFLLSPMFDVCGIVATHFESKAKRSGETMEKSFQEVRKLLNLAQIDDVPAFRGCQLPLESRESTSSCEGVSFIIEQAKKQEGKLYVAVLGAMTNVAAAINETPEIGENMVILWNGGGPYPEGRPEFNVMQDTEAVQTILEKEVEVWQIPQDVYASLEVSLAELAKRVRPCGQLGLYLYEQLIEENQIEYNPNFLLRTGENWTLGDNAVVAVLLMNRFRGNWEMKRAPKFKADLTYQNNPEGKLIRVYNSLDVRLTLEDLFCKLELAYGNNFLLK